MILDVFNLLNSDSATRMRVFVGDRYFYSGEPAFGLPSGVIAPRQAQLGVRLVF